jgi:hypothetical protein
MNILKRVFNKKGKKKIEEEYDPKKITIKKKFNTRHEQF